MVVTWFSVLVVLCIRVKGEQQPWSGELQHVLEESGFVAWDCTKVLDTQPFSLAPDDTCVGQSFERLTTTDTQGTLVELQTVQEVKGYACSSMMATREVYCSYHNYPISPFSEMNMKGFMRTQVSVAVCAKAVTSKRYGFGGRDRVITVPGSISLRDGTQFDGQGFCNTYKETVSYQEEVFDIRAVTVLAELDIDSKVFSYSLTDGSPIESSTPGMGKMDSGIAVVWDPLSVKAAPLAKVYEGEAKIIKYTNGKSLLHIPKISVSVVLFEAEEVLGIHANKTEYEKAFWVNAIKVPASAFPLQPKPQLGGLFIYTTFHSVVADDLVAQDAKLYAYRNMCKLERAQREAAVTRSDLTPEQLAWVVFSQRGLTLTMAGNMLRLGKCRRFLYQFRSMSDCFDMVPIQEAKTQEPWFLDPTSRAVSKAANKLSCGDPSVPVLMVNGQYRTLTPNPHVISGVKHLPSKVDFPKLRTAFDNSIAYGVHVVGDLDRSLLKPEAERLARSYSLSKVSDVFQVASTAVKSTLETMKEHAFAVSSTAVGAVWLSVLSVLMSYLFISRRPSDPDTSVWSRLRSLRRRRAEVRNQDEEMRLGQPLEIL